MRFTRPSSNGIESIPYQEGDQVLYAHNLPLELWAELGLAGAVLAVALYIAVAVAVVRARMSSALWLAGVGVVAFLLSNLVDFPWHLAGTGAVWALGLGVVIAADRSRGSPKLIPRSARAGGGSRPSRSTRPCG